MTNAEIIAKIRAEIERQLNSSNEKRGLARRTKDYYNEVAYGAEMGVCNRLLPFLSTLESEKPMAQEGLEEEIKRYYDDMDGDCRYVQTARHFYDLGCRRTAEKFDELEYNRQRAEEPPIALVAIKPIIPAALKPCISTFKEQGDSSEIPKDLEEAAWGYASKECEKDAFIAGAKWDREQMLKGAVEIGTTEICWEQDSERAFPTFDPPVDDLLMPGIISQRFNEGDKVRIIIVKED